MYWLEPLCLYIVILESIVNGQLVLRVLVLEDLDPAKWSHNSCLILEESYLRGV